MCVQGKAYTYWPCAAQSILAYFMSPRSPTRATPQSRHHSPGRKTNRAGVSRCPQSLRRRRSVRGHRSDKSETIKHDRTCATFSLLKSAPVSPSLRRLTRAFGKVENRGRNSCHGSYAFLRRDSFTVRPSVVVPRHHRSATITIEVSCENSILRCLASSRLPPRRWRCPSSLSLCLSPSLRFRQRSQRAPLACALRLERQLTLPAGLVGEVCDAAAGRDLLKMQMWPFSLLAAEAWQTGDGLRWRILNKAPASLSVRALARSLPRCKRNKIVGTHHSATGNPSASALRPPTHEFPDRTARGMKPPLAGSAGSSLRARTPFFQPRHESHVRLARGGCFASRFQPARAPCVPRLWPKAGGPVPVFPRPASPDPVAPFSVSSSTPRFA